MSFQDDGGIQPEWPCCREAKASGKIGCLGPHNVLGFITVTSASPSGNIALTNEQAIELGYAHPIQNAQAKTADDELADMRHNQVRRSLDTSPFLAEHGVDQKRMCIPTPSAEPAVKESWAFVTFVLGAAAFAAIATGLACLVQIVF